MGYFIVKRYHRRDPKSSTVMELAGEWRVQASDNDAVEKQARAIIQDCRPHEDYVVIRDADGKKVWETPPDA